MVNADKVERALHGTTSAEGRLIGGVEKPDGSVVEEELLAEYDRLGGLITKNGDKVKTGSFYDFAARCPREEVAVEYVYRVNGEEVVIPEGVELPGEVRAAKVAGVRPKRGRKPKVQEESAE